MWQCGFSCYTVHSCERKCFGRDDTVLGTHCFGREVVFWFDRCGKLEKRNNEVSVLIKENEESSLLRQL